MARDTFTETYEQHVCNKETVKGAGKVSHWGVLPRAAVWMDICCWVAGLYGRMSQGPDERGGGGWGPKTTAGSRRKLGLQEQLGGSTAREEDGRLSPE